jgi:hypothetical protein
MNGLSSVASLKAISQPPPNKCYSHFGIGSQRHAYGKHEARWRSLWHIVATRHSVQRLWPAGVELLAISGHDCHQDRSHGELSISCRSSVQEIAGSSCLTLSSAQNSPQVHPIVPLTPPPRKLEPLGCGYLMDAQAPTFEPSTAHVTAKNEQACLARGTS